MTWYLPMSLSVAGANRPHKDDEDGELNRVPPNVVGGHVDLPPPRYGLVRDEQALVGFPCAVRVVCAFAASDHELEYTDDDDGIHEDAEADVAESA